MKKNSLKDPPVQTYAELGDYWGDKDLGDIWEETEPAQFDVEIQSERRYYPVELDLSERIAETARRRGVSSETLVNVWLREKIDQIAIGN
ncbi:MAG: CopG family antitoxin [Desulfatiglandaceae bacterium]